MFGRNYRIGYVKLYRMKLELLQKGHVCISSWTFIFHVSEVLHNSMNNCYSLIQMYNDLKGWVAVIALTDSNLLKFTHKSYAYEPVTFSLPSLAKEADSHIELTIPMFWIWSHSLYNPFSGCWLFMILCIFLPSLKQAIFYEWIFSLDKVLN